MNFQCHKLVHNNVLNVCVPESCRNDGDCPTVGNACTSGSLLPGKCLQGTCNYTDTNLHWCTDNDVCKLQKLHPSYPEVDRSSLEDS